MLDMPQNLSSLMSALQCGACPQFGEQFDTDCLSSEWSHVYGEAAATKFDIYISFFPPPSHLSAPHHRSNFCLASYLYTLSYMVIITFNKSQHPN